MTNQFPYLVRTATEDGLYLHGYFAPGDKAKSAILHIHGFEGNFYENWFVHVLSQRLHEMDVTLLSANTRGNGRSTDFNTVSGGYRKVGSWYERLEEAYLDIDAWIKFLLDAGYTNIILQGHSLGTYKAIRYLFEGSYIKSIKKLLLLAPFDKKGMFQKIMPLPLEEMLAKAQVVADLGKGEELLNSNFKSITMSYQTFVSWYKQDDLGRVFEFCTSEYSSPVLQKITIPTKIIVGSKDEYFHLSNPEHPEEALEMMLQALPKGEGKIIEGANHSYHTHEDVLASEVTSFIK